MGADDSVIGPSIKDWRIMIRRCSDIKENRDIANMIISGEIEKVKRMFSPFDLERKGNCVREILIDEPEDQYFDGFYKVFGWTPDTRKST